MRTGSGYPALPQLMRDGGGIAFQGIAVAAGAACLRDQAFAGRKRDVEERGQFALAARRVQFPGAIAATRSTARDARRRIILAAGIRGEAHLVLTSAEHAI